MDDADSGHLFLIGYRGSGKSTVGKLLAQELGWQFVDTDERIVRTAGTTIAEIFEAEGEVGFRDREEQAVAEVSQESSAHVVALGGGAILREGNREVLSERGRCIWLDGSAEQLFKRIQKDAHSQANRPQLTDRSGYDEVVDVMTQRRPIYAGLARFTIETDQLTPEEIVKKIIDWVT